MPGLEPEALEHGRLLKAESCPYPPGVAASPRNSCHVQGLGQLAAAPAYPLLWPGLEQEGGRVRQGSIRSLRAQEATFHGTGTGTQMICIFLKIILYCLKYCLKYMFSPTPLDPPTLYPTPPQALTALLSVSLGYVYMHTRSLTDYLPPS